MVYNENKKSGMTLSEGLIWTAFVALLIRFAYQYINQPYLKHSVFASSIISSSNNNVYSSSLNLFIIVCFFGAAFLSLFKIKKINFSAIYIYILLVFGIIWTVVSLLGKYDIVDIVNSSTSPIILIMSVCVFIGYDEKVWAVVKKACFLSSIVYTIISLYETVRFLSKYGFEIRLMTSGALYAAVAVVFLMYFTLLFNDEILRKHKIIIAAEICIILFVVVVLQSRSWLLHGLLLLCIFIYKLSRTYKYKKTVLIALIVVIICVIALCWNYLMVISGNLLDRIDSDSRTGQIEAFFSQVSFLDLLTGGGIGASYICFGQNFLYIDNLVLLTMFKFGMIPTFAYLLLLLKPIFYGLTHRKSPARKGILFLIAWLAVMLGLSIYVSYSNNVYNFVIYIVIGRMMYLAQKDREKKFNAEIIETN